MPSRIIVHHSCCSETPFSPKPGRDGSSFLIHVDGTVSKLAPATASPGKNWNGGCGRFFLEEEQRVDF